MNETNEKIVVGTATYKDFVHAGLLCIRCTREVDGQEDVLYVHFNRAGKTVRSQCVGEYIKRGKAFGTRVPYVSIPLAVRREMKRIAIQHL